MSLLFFIFLKIKIDINYKTPNNKIDKWLKIYGKKNDVTAVKLKNKLLLCQLAYGVFNSLFWAISFTVTKSHAIK